MPPKSGKGGKKARTAGSVSLSGRKNEFASDSGGGPPSDGHLSHPTSCNQKGFLALPNEIVAMIVSFFPEIQPQHVLSNPTVVNGRNSPSYYYQRFKVLRALSQACRLSRKMYLPLLWERFQVCLAPDNATWFRTLGMALERKSKGMLESPHLWPYVRVVTVAITRFKTATVLPPFVELLRTLPNVHTIEISHAHSAISPALKSAFEGNVFPTIRKVIMPTCAQEILRCCPSVEDVSCNEDDGGRLVGALAFAGCDKLEVIRNIAPGSTLMKRFIKANPPLRCIGISARLKEREEVIRACSAFPTLRILEISCEEGRTDVDHLVKLAQDALRASETHKPPKRAKNSRVNSSNAERSLSEPRDLYSDPKLVRVVYFLKLPGPWSHAWTPAHFIPQRVIDFPV